MQNLNFQKILIIALALIVVAVASFFLLKPKLVPEPEGPGPVATSSEPVIVQAAEGQLPEGFPADLPLNGKASIAQSYTATYPDSAVKQWTAIFESSKTKAENYAFYTKWAQDNGWPILSKENSSQLTFLYLRRAGGEDINITITSGKDKTKSEVSISYVKF